MALQYIKESEYNANPSAYPDRTNLVLYPDNAVEVNADQGYYVSTDSKGKKKYSLRKKSGGSTTVYADSLDQALKEATASGISSTDFVAGTAFFSNPEEAAQLQETEQLFERLPYKYDAAGNIIGGGGVTEDPATKAAIREGKSTPNEEQVAAQLKTDLNEPDEGNNTSISMREGGGRIIDGQEFDAMGNPVESTTQAMMEVPQVEVNGSVSVPNRTGFQALQPGETEADRITRLRRYGQFDPAKELEDIQSKAATISSAVNNLPTEQTASQLTGFSSKYGLPPLNQMQTQFNNDPLSYISNVTKQILDMSGAGEANSLIEIIADEIEDIENERDKKIRNINDDPWITEGVRLQRVQKIETEYEDRLANRTNRLTLLQDTRDSAIKNAQWAIGTAVSMFDAERKFQQDQLQFYYDQAQREWDNQFKVDNENRRRDEFEVELDLKLQNLSFEEQRLGFESQRLGLDQARYDLEVRKYLDTLPGASVGQFGSAIDNASLLVGAERGKASKEAMQNAIESGDYASAYALIGNNVEESLTGDVKTKFANARTDYAILSNMRDAIEAFEAAGGDTGFLKGTADAIARRFGQLKTDPKFASLAVQLEREFQSYRQNMTGAAFSPGESREYAAVNPRTSASIDLNLATIDGAMNQLENRITSTINTRVPGADQLYSTISGSVSASPETTQVGSIVEIDGISYRKIGPNEFEEI